MRTRQEVINYCLSLCGAYEDHPFDVGDWTVMRHGDNRKMFAAICEREGNVWVNVKCDPMLTYMWRSTYNAVVPAYHMNKYHWNSIILDGTVPTDDIKQMLCDSYELTKAKKRSSVK